MTTPLFLLRCKQLGLSMTELDMLTIGLINDMFTERENDDYDGWNEMASQSDFDAFLSLIVIMSTAADNINSVIFNVINKAVFFVDSSAVLTV